MVLTSTVATEHRLAARDKQLTSYPRQARTHPRRESMLGVNVERT